MPVLISLLRGVNVGGHHKIKMDELRALYESLGLEDPRTCLQSGNVVFRTEKRDLVPLAGRIADAIGQRVGFRPDVMLRTSSEWRDAIAGNPFAARRDLDLSHLVAIFLAGDPGPEARERLLAIPCAPEELRIGARVLYVYYANGIARATLSLPVIEKALRTSGTGRNWNTVEKLQEIAEELRAKS